MNYIIGGIMFLAGLAWYLYERARTATVTTAVAVRPPRGRHRLLVQGASGSQVASDFIADDGLGWRGPQPGERLARYARVTAPARTWFGQQLDFAWERRNRDALAMSAWREENSRKLAEHAVSLAEMRREWDQFASVRAGYQRRARP